MSGPGVWAGQPRTVADAAPISNARDAIGPAAIGSVSVPDPTNSAAPSMVVVAGVDLVEPHNPERFAKYTVVDRELHNEITTNGTVAWDIGRAVPVNCFTNGRAIMVPSFTRLGR